jgi:uncharacterized protein YdhG (YjbR/CyaY superfamily)
MEDVAEFIAGLDPGEKTIVNRLRNLILDTDPRLQEKLSYGVPYFFHNRRVCFIWPASHFPCSEDKRKEYTEKVQLGFCYGNFLSNEQGMLLAEGRKQVYLMKFTSPSEINDQIIREIVMEAVMVDDSFRSLKKKSTKTKSKR